VSNKTIGYQLDLGDAGAFLVAVIIQTSTGRFRHPIFVYLLGDILGFVPVRVDIICTCCGAGRGPNVFLELSTD
jgi:hypothetical protein